ncbi:unnamed protein product, partial [Ectocarpus sp. 8 AP-2014]
THSSLPAHRTGPPTGNSQQVYQAICQKQRKHDGTCDHPTQLLGENQALIRTSPPAECPRGNTNRTITKSTQLDGGRRTMSTGNVYRRRNLDINDNHNCCLT